MGWHGRPSRRLRLPQRAQELPEVRPLIAPWINSFVMGQGDLLPTVGSDNPADFEHEHSFVRDGAAGLAAQLDVTTTCFWVTTPMVDLFTAAARSFPATSDCLPLPSPLGFVAFAGGVRVWPMASQLIRGFFWAEEVAVPLVSFEGPGDPVGAYAEAGITPIPLTGYDGAHRLGWHETSVDLWRIMATCTTMMQQRIAVTAPVEIDRATRRRLVRAGLPPAPNIRLIDLRRPTEREGHPGPGSPVEWSHRWIVDGHWRNQWHPAEKKHQPVWIAPHVKGPEDKPLVVGERVYRWSR